MQTFIPSQISHNGFHYFSQGWKLIMLPGIKRYVILPLLVNVLLMGSSFWWLFNKLGSWIPALMSYIPEWLQWLSYVVWALAILSILLIFGYIFSSIANVIAAPFNGLLAEQLENKLTGKNLPEMSFFDMFKDIPRIMKRELQKFGYYIPRALIILLLYFIPTIGQLAFPILWFLFSAKMLSLQYCDYPFDNHRVPFKTMRDALNKDQINNLQFGSLVSLCTMIPILNLVIMPVAVCGATSMWVDRYYMQHHRS